jgi:hypothetical protein
MIPKWEDVVDSINKGTKLLETSHFLDKAYHVFNVTSIILVILLLVVVFSAELHPYYWYVAVTFWWSLGIKWWCEHKNGIIIAEELPSALEEAAKKFSIYNLYKGQDDAKTTDTGGVSTPSDKGSVGE